MNSIKYKSFNKFLIRTPLLPLNYIQSIFRNQNTSNKELKNICNNPQIQEAIFLASPVVLNDQLIRWLNNELKVEKDLIRLKESVIKYILRMGSRCESLNKLETL